jgi:hypothetical protein
MVKITNHRYLWVEARINLGYALNRAQLNDIFNLGMATASRVIGNYRKLAPDNLHYNLSDKCWQKAITFKPHFFIGPLEGCEEDYLTHIAVHVNYGNLNKNIAWP